MNPRGLGDGKPVHPKRRDGVEARRRIMVAVTVDPGIHVTQLAQVIGLAWHTTAYHLRVLERRRLIRIHKAARERYVFLPGIRAARRRWLTATRQEPALGILRAMQGTAPQGVPSLSRRLGVSDKVVRHNVARLTRARLLEAVGQWHPKYRIPAARTAEVTAFLAERAERDLLTA